VSRNDLNMSKKETLECRLIQPDKAGKGEEHDFVKNLDRQGAEAKLRGLIPGSVLLRIDKEKAGKKAPLILSYRFETVVFHVPLSKAVVKITLKKEETLCKLVQPSSMGWLTSSLFPFLNEKLYVFIIEVVSNKNWIEKELPEEEVEKELRFRDFVVCPTHQQSPYGSIIIYKKEKTKLASISISVNFDTLEMTTIINMDKVSLNKSKHTSFNSLLFDFVEVDETKSFRVQQTLGYDLSDFRKKMNSKVATLDLIQASCGTSKGKIHPKEKKTLLATILLTIEETRSPTKYPVEVQEAFGTIKMLVMPNENGDDGLSKDEREKEKMDWIQNGIFSAFLNLIGVVSHCRFDGAQYPIEILRYFLQDSLPACSEFYRSFFTVLENNLEPITPKSKVFCAGLCNALTNLIHVPPLISVFQTQSGIARLTKIYSFFSMHSTSTPQRLHMSTWFIQKKDKPASCFLDSDPKLEKEQSSEGSGSLRASTDNALANDIRQTSSSADMSPREASDAPRRGRRKSSGSSRLALLQRFSRASPKLPVLDGVESVTFSEGFDQTECAGSDEEDGKPSSRGDADQSGATPATSRGNSTPNTPPDGQETPKSHRDPIIGFFGASGNSPPRSLRTTLDPEFPKSSRGGADLTSPPTSSRGPPDPEPPRRSVDRTSPNSARSSADQPPSRTSRGPEAPTMVVSPPQSPKSVRGGPEIARSPRPAFHRAAAEQIPTEFLRHPRGDRSPTTGSPPTFDENHQLNSSVRTPIGERPIHAQPLSPKSREGPLSPKGTGRPPAPIPTPVVAEEKSTSDVARDSSAPLVAPVEVPNTDASPVIPRIASLVANKTTNSPRRVSVGAKTPDSSVTAQSTATEGSSSSDSNSDSSTGSNSSGSGSSGSTSGSGSASNSSGSGSGTDSSTEDSSSSSNSNSSSGSASGASSSCGCPSFSGSHSEWSEGPSHSSSSTSESGAGSGSSSSGSGSGSSTQESTTSESEEAKPPPSAPLGFEIPKIKMHQPTPILSPQPMPFIPPIPIMGAAGTVITPPRTKITPRMSTSGTPIHDPNLSKSPKAPTQAVFKSSASNGSISMSGNISHSGNISVSGSPSSPPPQSTSPPNSARNWKPSGRKNSLGSSPGLITISPRKQSSPSRSISPVNHEGSESSKASGGGTHTPKLPSKPIPLVRKRDGGDSSYASCGLSDDPEDSDTGPEYSTNPIIPHTTRRGDMTGSGDTDTEESWEIETSTSNNNQLPISLSIDDGPLNIKPINMSLVKPNSLPTSQSFDDVPFIDGRPQLKLSFPSAGLHLAPSESIDSPDHKSFHFKIPVSPASRSMDDDAPVHHYTPPVVDHEADCRALAKKLGETYVSADLVTLLQFKEAFQDRMQEKKERAGHTRLLSRESKWLLGIDKRVNTLVIEKPITSIKCDILKVFSAITENHFNMRSVGPINLMFSELLALQTHKNYKKEKDELEPLIHQMIGNIAAHVEIQHNMHWNSVTKGMAPNLRVAFRQKLDKMLWRSHTRILTAIQTGDLQEIATQLTILGNYVNNANTRIMASQAVNVCMKTILTVKQYIFSLPNVSTSSFQTLPIIHALLGIFNGVANQTHFEPLHDLLLKILVFKGESWMFVQEYTVVVLADSAQLFRNVMRKDPTKEASFENQIKVRVISHYTAILGLMERKYKGEEQNLASNLNIQSVVLRKMDFLTAPNGILQGILAQETTSYELKVAALDLIHKMFSFNIKDSPFFEVAYFESYISFHYLHFLRLYHNTSVEATTLTLIQKHLQILINFALNKNEKIVQKFYQLQVMQWMMSQINLEYEVKLLAKNLLQREAEEAAKKEAAEIESPPTETEKPREEDTPLNPSPSLVVPPVASPVVPLNIPSLAIEPKRVDTVQEPKTIVVTVSPPAEETNREEKRRYHKHHHDCTKKKGDKPKNVEPVKIPPIGGFGIPSLVPKIGGGVPAIGGPPAIGGLGNLSAILGQRGEPAKIKVSAESKTVGGTAADRSLTRLTPATPEPAPLVIPKLGSGGPPAVSGVPAIGGPPAIGGLGNLSAILGQRGEPAKVTIAKPVPGASGGTAQSRSLMGPSNPPAASPTITLEQPKIGGLNFSGLSRGEPAKVTVSKPAAGSESRGTAQTRSLMGPSQPKKSEPEVPAGIPPIGIPPIGIPTLGIKKPDSDTSTPAPFAIPPIGGGGDLPKIGGLNLGGLSRGEPAKVTISAASKAAGGTAASRSLTGQGAKGTSPPKKPNPEATSLGIPPISGLGSSRESKSGSNSSPSPAGGTSPAGGASPSGIPALGGLGIGGLNLGGLARGEPARVKASSASKPGSTAQNRSILQGATSPPSAVATATSEPVVAPLNIPASRPESGSGKNDGGRTPEKQHPGSKSPGKTRSILTISSEPLEKVGSKPDTMKTTSPPKPAMIPKALHGQDPSRFGVQDLDPNGVGSPRIGSPPLPNVASPRDRVTPRALVGNPTKLDSMSKTDKMKPKDPGGKPSSGNTSGGSFQLKGNSTKINSGMSRANDASSFGNKNINGPVKFGQKIGSMKEKKKTVRQLIASKGNVEAIMKAEIEKKNSEEESKPEEEKDDPIDAEELTGSEVMAPIEDPALDRMEQKLYQTKRHNKKMYKDDNLHVSILHFISISLLSVNGFTLEPLYTSQFPMRNLKMNIMFILRLHLNHPANERIIGRLADVTHNLKYTNPSLGKSSALILKLFLKRLFQPSLLTQFSPLGTGAYGKIYACKLLGEDVAVKQMNVPPSIHDRCVPHDIFTEILILDKWKNDERICKLIDFGTDNNSFWIVMKRYKTSLKSWRSKQTKGLDENIILYLNIYSEILNISKFFSESMVNHFDIKADNFLIEYDPHLNDEELFNNPTDVPNFRICLADFGESQVYTSAEDNFTTENRGTEYIKSPEMLTVAYAAKKDNQAYDRLRKIGAGPASDIWSLGCLFFELLLDKLLFYDPIWVQFYVRVTTPMDLFTPENAGLLADYPDAITFLKSVLIRDPKYRPTIQDMIRGYKVCQTKIMDQVQKQKQAAADAIKDTEKSCDNGAEGSNAESKPDSPVTGAETPKDDSGAKSNKRPTLTRQASSTFLLDKVKKKLGKGDAEEKKQAEKQREELELANKLKAEYVAIMRKKKETQRKQHLQQINYNAVQYSEEELEFFRKTPTKVTNYLYLGDWSNCSQRAKLQVEYGITHIADCTNAQDNVYTDHFFFKKIDPNTDLDSALKIFTPFVKSAVSDKGKILVAYDDSFGPCMVIGYIMDSFQKTFFEAFQMVHKNRYVIHLNARLIQDLLSWEHKDIKQHFSCICGANKWILLEPLDQTEHQNPVPCCCKVSSSSESPCPYIGCSTFLEAMNEKHGFHDEVVRWGYTPRDNVQGDFEFCEEFNPEFDLSREQRENITSKNWRVHRCRRCGFLTHAVQDDKFAVVTNKKTLLNEKLESRFAAFN